MMLSPHFHLDEYTASETAARRGIDNTPPEELLGNLKRMAQVMEQVRSLLGSIIIVTSGYRCIELNTLIGSKPTSAHVQGLATDFISPSYGTPLAVCQAIAPHVQAMGIDQLIYEVSWVSWVHIGLRRSGDARGQLLTLSGNGYFEGIIGG